MQGQPLAEHLDFLNMITCQPDGRLGELKEYKEEGNMCQKQWTPEQCGYSTLKSTA